MSTPTVPHAAAMTEEWEYMYHNVKMGDFNKEMAAINAAGRDGWEMVSGVPITGGGGTGSVLLLFKRRIR